MNWSELKRSSIDEVVDWASGELWCRDMAKCSQDSQWHAEGDVWTHTRWVMRQLVELEYWSIASNEQKLILIFTALLHDVAKPMTTRIDELTGRTISPKHAQKGEYLARSILRNLGCDIETREKICRMVRYHGRPIFLHEKERPTHEVIRLSWLVENELLYQFSLADKRGRSSVVDSRNEENLYYWKLVAEESNCLNSPYPFVSDHARFTFFNSSTPDHFYEPHETFKSHVTIMSGLPGSGKDTWIQSNLGDVPTVSLDDIRTEMKIDPTDNQGAVVQEAKERCRKHLRAGDRFVFNATNTIRQTRRRWVDLFAKYNARIEIVYLEPPLDRILDRNSNRTASVPKSVIEKLAASCEPPTWAECHNLIYV